MSRKYDAMNCSINGQFGIMTFDVMRDNKLSAKAKTLLTTLLSNQEGWTSYMETLINFNSDGRDSIRSGLKELEIHGYLWRIHYVCKKTKQKAGAFWAYTNIPGQFNIDKHLQELDEDGYEIWSKSKTPPCNNPEAEKPKAENPMLGMPILDNPPLIITTNNYSNDNQSTLCRKTFSRTKQPKKDSPVDKNQKYVPLAVQLAQIIKEKKRFHIPNSQIDKWADEIRRLCKTSKINPLRIKRALNWYAKHIGEEFVPEIFAGGSLRKKFTNLENAMERSKNPYQQNDTRPNQSKHETGMSDEWKENLERKTTQVF